MTGAASPDSSTLEPGEQARADVYRILGALLAGPPAAALIEMLRGITPDEAESGAAMTAAWQALQAAAEHATPAALEDEYFNLFIGLGRGELVPYASFYIHGFLMEKVLASLRDELAALGITRRAGVAEPEDHAAAVCEIMGMIIAGHGLHLRQLAFFESYIGTWLGRFFEDLGKAETADFYRAVALLGQQFLAVERQYFTLPD
ncbi:MAG TPA: molecular chaperone TorD family protein [Gammaproteobacteria bacterium]|nr:molecular chaperone TorD family protein [Gammaproteobacteria bacterium]